MACLCEEVNNKASSAVGECSWVPRLVCVDLWTLQSEDPRALCACWMH